MQIQLIRNPHFHSILLYLGAMSWFIGNFIAWHFGVIAAGITWWIGFLLFTIVGERLEPSQFLPVPTWSKKALGALLGLFFKSHPHFYDLVLHTFFLGFTSSMIWAHAPIIFPTIFGIRETPYHQILWWPWILFQVTLLGRIGFGLVENFEWRKIMGISNGYLILLMFGFMVAIVIWKIKSLQSRSFNSN